MEFYNSESLTGKQKPLQNIKALVPLAILILLIFGINRGAGFLFPDDPPIIQIGDEELEIDMSLQEMTERGFVIYTNEEELLNPEEWEIEAETVALESYKVGIAGSEQNPRVSVWMYNPEEKTKLLSECLVYKINISCISYEEKPTPVKIYEIDYLGMSAQESMAAMSASETLVLDEKGYRSRPSVCLFKRDNYQYILQFDYYGLNLEEITIKKDIQYKR